MDSSHKIIKTICISTARANLITLVVFLPLLIAFKYLFIFAWDRTIYSLGMQVIVHKPYLVFVALVLGIVAHEGIHGLTWALQVPKGFSSISFGINWKSLTPYCHCNKPMKRNQYLLGGIMPCIALGMIPLLIGFVAGISWLTLAGVVFIGAACGDIISTIKLLGVSRDAIILDHPDCLGFIVYGHS